LVRAMNAHFAEPLVTLTRGGPKGGGAQVTETGRRVLAEYQAIERDDYRAAEPDNVSTGCGFGFLGSEAPTCSL